MADREKYFFRIVHGAALVTGGSSPLGGEVARALAAHGVKVAMTYHGHKERADKIVAEIRGEGGDVAAFPGDLQVPEECQRVLAQAREAFGPVGILVLNAGLWRPRPIEEMTPGDVEEMLAVNAKSGLYLTRAAIPQMRELGGGRIVFFPSAPHEGGNPANAHYDLSKFGLIGAIRSLGMDLAKDNILVNGVAPGWIEKDVALEKMLPGSQQIIARIPLGLGNRFDIAGAVLFFCSNYSNYVTGEVLSVSGGRVSGW